MRGRGGFTLIELVLVIAILGVLAVSALPNIFNISVDAARDNSRDAVAGAVQAALSLYGAKEIADGKAETYPDELDAQLGGTAAARDAPLFVTVLKGGVTRGWTKKDATCYDYTGAGGFLGYAYTKGAGTFIGIAADGACP